MNEARLIVGISGASGTIYGIRMLQLLKQYNVKTHLIISKTAQLTCSIETKLTFNELKQLADEYHSVTDLAANISSGSFKTMGMVIAPCSTRTLAAIATGNTDNLLTRAADVILKDRRRLVLMVRESPLHLGHLRNMLQVTEMGAIIAPPTPAFYNEPTHFDDIINHSIGRVLDLFDIEIGIVRRWK